VNAEVIAAVIVTAAICGAVAFAALMNQAGNHEDDRADLLRGQLFAYRAGQASVLAMEPEPEGEPWPGPEWWDRQFDGITSGLSDGEEEGL
jgi:hypothetical protein